MSLAQPPAQERRPSPSLELGTNNPFRTRVTGGPLSPTSTVDPFTFGPSGQRERPKSRNPFLDVFDDDNDVDFGTNNAKPVHRANSFDASSAQKPQLTGSAAELFENLTLTDNSASNMNRPAPPPFGSKSRPPPPGHHKSRSGLDDVPLISIDSFPTGGSRPAPPPGGRRPPPPSSRQPQSSSDRSRDAARRRPRRNSDSSVIDAHESETRDRNRKERRARDGKSRGENGTKSRREGSSDRRKKNSALDVIDKLDVTGIYGSGLFHHDGPFDACNPHRNKNSRRLAPVQAFPADSANNSMSGFGPLNEKADHSHIFGNRDAEAFHDYTSNGSRPSANRATSFDPKAAVETLHGDESLGLGTSTFLDGAPASRVAMQKTVTEAFEDRPRSSSDGAFGGGIGIQRKKSLAQKIRSIKPDGPITSRRRAPPPPGGRRSPSGSPTTPNDSKDGYFFNDYDDAYDKKGENITAAESDRKRERAPSSPKKPHPGLNRVGTDDANSNGLLKRVRSLSKPKRRNE
ncbi:Pal1-domain-containing protein [Wilcoxina mikolae CBS 423.85]|nr:Pal1-domain-containing protein [Wilcoxina mikolae CBS 423.85]